MNSLLTRNNEGNLFIIIFIKVIVNIFTVSSNKLKQFLRKALLVSLLLKIKMGETWA